MVNRMGDDTISRQATIDAIEQHKTAVLGDREWDEGIAYGYAAAHRHFVDIVKQLPSAMRYGMWKRLYKNNYKCSACGSWWTCEGIPIESGLLYCPTCGAKMNEVDYGN